MAIQDTHTAASSAAVERPERAGSARRLVLLVVWGAFLGALAELAARIVIWIIGDSVVNSFTLNPQAVWLAPLANVPLFAFVAAVIALLVRDPDWRIRTMLAAVVALVVLEVGLVSERLHPAALALLGVGIGVQLSRMHARWPAWNWRFIRGSALLLVAASWGGGIAWNVRQSIHERRALGALRPVSADAPNVLLLVLDTVRAIELSLYGYELDTSPVLRRLAREGIRFDRAFATSSWTLTSHASMFTGRLPNETSAGWQTPLDRRWPTLAAVMTDAGYATGGFAANLLYCSWLHGLGRGFITYRDYAVSAGEALHSTNLWRHLVASAGKMAGREIRPGRVTAAAVNDAFLDWQDRIGKRPFFAFLNYFDAHTPYAPPAPFDTMFLEGREPLLRTAQVRQPSTPEEFRDMRRAYDGAIRYVDQEIGRLLEELERRGSLRQTLIIITADHGEAFGERGYQGHGTSLYAPQTWVPLLVLVPGRSVRDRVVVNPVSLRDVAATVLDAAGIDQRTIPGASLARWWDGSSPALFDPRSMDVFSHVRRPGGKVPPMFPLAGGDLASVISDGWQLIHRSDGEEELYNIARNPLTVRSLADSVAFDSVQRLLQRRLADTSAVIFAATRVGAGRSSR
jgi:arylsulfatase A-like enzyme